MGLSHNLSFDHKSTFLLLLLPGDDKSKEKRLVRIYKDWMGEEEDRLTLLFHCKSTLYGAREFKGLP